MTFVSLPLYGPKEEEDTDSEDWYEESPVTISRPIPQTLPLPTREISLLVPSHPLPTLTLDVRGGVGP